MERRNKKELHGCLGPRREQRSAPRVALAAGRNVTRLIGEAKTMSTTAIALIVYFFVAIASMVALCRAAARGDREMDVNRHGAS